MNALETVGESRRDEADPLVRIRDVVKHFPVRGVGGRRAWVRSVDGVSLDIERGEIMGLVGESGCGKSTLARLALHHTKADRGSVTIDGRDLFRMKAEELRRFRRFIQMVFQDPAGALDPRMRIERSLSVPLGQHGIGTPRQRLASVGEALADVGLDPSIARHYPDQCSGGQLQRIVIARALLLRPRFLICDEPISAVDASIRAQVLNLLAVLRRRFDLTLLMISHDLRAMRHICDRVAVMYLGNIVEIAPVDELFAAPAHPYSQALIAASLLDEIGLENASRLARGEPPSPVRPPPGCRFHPRCPLADERCSRERPRLQAATRSRRVACHHWRRPGPGKNPPSEAPA